MYPDHIALRGLDSLLRPKSIVVIGASAKRRANGNEALGNLALHEFAGTVHVVHPAAEEIEGHATVSAIADLPDGVDMALLSLPARAVVPTLRELEAAGCRSAVVPSVGMTPAELGELRHFVATASLVVHGPNCLGYLNYHDHTAAWLYEGQLAPVGAPSNISLVSQSGSGSLFVARSLEGAQIGKIISTGSEVGLSTENYLSWLARDTDTQVVGLVLESLKDVPAFRAAVTELRRTGTSLVVLKVGRTAAGATATTAHTGALVGGDEVYTAFFDELDVPLVADYDELASALQVVSRYGRGARPRGNRVAAVTISGGQAALAADLAAARGVTLAAFAPATAQRLAELLPAVSVHNPLDTGDEDYATETGYGDAIAAIAADPQVDSVLVVLDAQQTLTSAESAVETPHFQDVTRVTTDTDAPLVVASSSSVSTDDAVRSLLGDVPLIRGIGNALTALRALSGNQRPVPQRAARPAGAPDAATVQVLRSDVAATGGVLPPELAGRLLAGYGIDLVTSTTVDSAPAALAWARGRYPVVAKIASPDIAHRSDIGAVVLDIADDTELHAALDHITSQVRAHHPNAAVDGFELQAQVPAGIEAMVGFVADPVFGATLTVGMGGTLVELLQDTAAAPVPVAPTQAAHLVSSTRLGSLMAGYRNLHPVTDPLLLHELLCKLSWLAQDFADLLAGADLNPVIVTPGTGAVHLVDALVEVSPR